MHWSGKFGLVCNFFNFAAYPTAPALGLGIRELLRLDGHVYKQDWKEFQLQDDDQIWHDRPKIKLNDYDLQLDCILGSVGFLVRQLGYSFS